MAIFSCLCLFVNTCMAGYLGSWKIDDAMTFTCNTHAADTGAATDADAVPAYRIYEDETGTPIVTGSMALIDDANTTGFYSEQVTLSAANGFEKGKSYSVYISAAVGSTTGTLSHTFQIEAEVDANTVSGVASANVTQIGGDAQSATDLKDFADAGYDPETDKVQGVVLVDTTTANSDMRGTNDAALASVLGAATGGVSIADDINDASQSTNAAIALVPANILATAYEGARTVEQGMRGRDAVLFGDLIKGTGSGAYRDAADSKDRITYTVDDASREVTVIDLD